ncbi:NHLP family bacteriocin export ABC transporter peptidase/permease/ATPase subunit [Mesorhizobium sp. ANAO-SY3R2]|uniref:NHLP family bacteriocin export ABC transporter peptidase/permease/ATPase subunit n=1 Tax=Mesorhizobium sp. ANAO-SY3R2 TaxID=3166644 RepID=UPI00366F4812
MTAVTANIRSGFAAARFRPRATPEILQIEAVECGAASLSIVLAHYGRWVTLEEMRIACGVSRDGTKASNLLKAARHYGLTAKGFRKEADKLADVPWPAVLHWNFNHFVVLEGIRGNRVFINDPATGRRTITKRELSDAFTGVVLAFEPSETFERAGAPALALPMMLERLKGSRNGLVYVLVASLALVVPGIAVPVFTRVFIDNILIGRQHDWFLAFAVAMLAVLLLRGAATALQQAGLRRLEMKQVVVPASKLLWHLLRLPAEFYAQRHPGEMASRLNANERIADLLSGRLASTVFNLTSLVAYAVILWLISPLLASCILATQVLYGFVVYHGGKVQRSQSIKLSHDLGNLLAATLGPIRAIETLKASNMEGQAYRHWAGQHSRVLGTRADLTLTQTLVNAIPAAIQALTAVLVLVLGAISVMQGQLSLGALVAFQGLAQSFNAPVLDLIGLAGQIQSIRADLVKIADVTRARPVAAGDEAAVPASSRVELDRISFGYSPLDLPLIEDFTLNLKPGARVALVGGSGSGKTTIGRLIAGLQTPWSGDIRIGGVNGQTLTQARRSNVIGYVDQEIFLFEGSVRDNLTLWDNSIPQAQLVAALSDAAILDDVLMRAGQLDAHVAEGGLNFSGGQRQRLELARVLSANPSLIVLDEATAALDPVTEKQIDDNLRRRGCGCLIIAHRLSTIRDCEEIIVLDQGRIVERGDHDTLMAMQGEYASLVRGSL